MSEEMKCPDCGKEFDNPKRFHSHQLGAKHGKFAHLRAPKPRYGLIQNEVEKAPPEPAEVPLEQNKEDAPEVPKEAPKAVTSGIAEWKPPDRFAEYDDLKEPGYRYRFLSEETCGRVGLRGWEPVSLKEDDLQDPAHRFMFGRGADGLARVGSEMFLARMPEEMARARDREMERRARLTEDVAKSEMARRIGGDAITTEEFSFSVFKGRKRSREE